MDRPLITIASYIVQWKVGNTECNIDYHICYVETIASSVSGLSALKIEDRLGGNDLKLSLLDSAVMVS